MFEPTFIISTGIVFIGAVVWAVRLEGRLNEHDQLFVEREKQTDDHHEELKSRLVRIETKLDRITGPGTINGENSR